MRRCVAKKQIPGHVIAHCTPSDEPGVDLYFALDEKNQPKAVLALRSRGKDLVVDAISVKDSKNMRQRLGTRLYEFATELACKDGKRLVSDVERSQYAEAFWRKQTGKGRSMCVEKGRGKFFGNPTSQLSPAEMRKLPMPGGPTGEEWPCKRYGVTRPCEVTSLEGIKRRRKR